MPAIPDDIRERLRSRLIEEGPAVLHAELSRLDPAMAEGLQPGDGQRIVRALEVIEATGKSIRDFQKASGPVIIDPERAQKSWFYRTGRCCMIASTGGLKP